MLIEARLSWGGDVLALAHRPARGVVRLADFALPGGETDDTIVFASGELVCDAIALEGAMVWLSLVEKEAPLGAGALGELRTTKGIVLAAVLHGTLLATAFLGRAAPHEEEAAQLATLKSLASAIDEREVAEITPQPLPDAAPSASAKKKEEGQAGNPMAQKPAGLAMRTRGSESPDTKRTQELREAREFGMIGLLTPREVAHSGGADPFGAYEGPSAVGSLFGTKIEDSFGMGGGGLTGVGLGGGGRGDVIVLDGIGQGFGTCGCGAGTSGVGISQHGKSAPRAHEVRSPVLRCGVEEKTGRETCTTQVNGRLPPEVVQRVVRQSFGRMRMCYEAGLKRNPSLEGRISVKFVIDRSGAVAMASTADRSFADNEVASCVERSFKSMSFPEPEGGIVTVVYPLVLST